MCGYIFSPILILKISSYGNGEIEGVGSFWTRKDTPEITTESGYADPIPENSDPNSGLLNLRTKARMNVPFGNISKFSENNFF